MSAKYCLPFPVFHFWPKLNHPTARSLCDSWATCYLLYICVLLLPFAPAIQLYEALNGWVCIVTVCLLSHCHRYYTFIVKSVCIRVSVLCDCRDWRLWMMAGPTCRRCGTQNRVCLHRATNFSWVIVKLSVVVVLCQCIQIKTQH